MKEKFVYALAVLFAVIALMGANTATKETSAQPIRSVLEVGSYTPNQVDLYFPSNPTTGYSWVVETENEEIVSIRDQYFEDSHELGMTGAGGIHWFHISGNVPGTTSVSFRYVRQWEQNDAAETILYRLTVNEQLDVLIWGVEAG